MHATYHDRPSVWCRFSGGGEEGEGDEAWERLAVAVCHMKYRSPKERVCVMGSLRSLIPFENGLRKAPCVSDKHFSSLDS